MYIYIHIYLYIKKVGQIIIFRAKNLQPPLRDAFRYAYAVVFTVEYPMVQSYQPYYNRNSSSSGHSSNTPLEKSLAISAAV